MFTKEKLNKFMGGIWSYGLPWFYGENSGMFENLFWKFILFCSIFREAQKIMSVLSCRHVNKKGTNPFQG